MNISQYKHLHKNLRIFLPNVIEFNPLDSATDPTQDIPIRNIELSAAGVPINVRDLSSRMPFTNIKAENLTSIEKRNNDKFDVYGELQDSATKVVSSGTTTDYVPFKNKLKHEI